MNFLNRFLNTTQWFSHLLLARFIILFPQFQDKAYYTSWYNGFDSFYYRAIGLRYDSVSKVYRDLYSNSYYFDYNQQIYWNHQNITFDKSGLRRSPDKCWAIDFLGNHYHWCYTRNRYLYSGFWSCGLAGHRLIKATPKPINGPNVAAQVFLLKNNPFEFKGGFITLVVSGFLTVNPIGDVSMMGKKLPELGQTGTVAEFRFKNLETVKQTRATQTPSLTKRFYQKSTRVSASQINPNFNLDYPVATVSVNPSTDARQYNTVNLLEDLGKCFDAHTKTILAQKQKQNLKVNPTLKTGIDKLYKQIDIATNLARKKQEWSKQGGVANDPTGGYLVRRLNESITKGAFDRQGKSIKGKLNQTVAQQLGEYSRFPLYGIKTLVAIKNDPEAALTKAERIQIDQEFAKTPYGVKMKAISSIRAHILSDSWSTVLTGKDSQKVLSYKLPFNRFPRQVINNDENFVITLNFLEKLLDSCKNIETGVFPTFLQKKFESNPAWRPEKNYIIANAFYDDFYLPALSHNEKKYALEIRKQLIKSKNNFQNQNSASKKASNREKSNQN